MSPIFISLASRISNKILYNSAKFYPIWMSFKTEINDYIYYQLLRWHNMKRSISFFAKFWIFPTRDGRENTNKKTQTVCAFSIFTQKNENKDKGGL